MCICVIVSEQYINHSFGILLHTVSDRILSSSCSSTIPLRKNLEKLKSFLLVYITSMMLKYDARVRDIWLWRVASQNKNLRRNIKIKLILEFHILQDHTECLMKNLMPKDLNFFRWKLTIFRPFFTTHLSHNPFGLRRHRPYAVKKSIESEKKIRDPTMSYMKVPWKLWKCFS